MSKTSHTSKDKLTGKKPRTKMHELTNKIFEEHRSIFTGETAIVDIQKLITEMFDYARNNPKARLVHFLHGRNIARRSFYEWCDRNSVLEQAFIEFKLMIADMREAMLLEKMDTGFLIRSLAFYDNEWRKFDDDRQQSKNAQTAQFSGDVTLIDHAKDNLKKDE